MVFTFFVPFILFVVVFATMSFSYIAGWVVFAIGAILTFAACLFAAFTIYDDWYDCKWYFLLALLMLIAIIFAAFFGYENYQQQTWEYNNHEGMGSYRDVDPEFTKPSLLMDASSITFLPGFAPDATQAMGFKNRHIYCVAPIRSMAAAGNATNGRTFQYWAVGIDCCTAYGQNFIYSFRCGEYNNPEAHGGIRIMGETEKSYYNLAVQQAEAAQGLKAPYPVFVKWTTNYMGELDKYYWQGRRNAVTGIVICVVVQAIVVTTALVLLEVLPKMMNAWYFV